MLFLEREHIQHRAAPTTIPLMFPERTELSRSTRGTVIHR